VPLSPAPADSDPDSDTGSLRATHP
jgi:hypothetical protein